MALTFDDLTARLDALEAALPDLVAQHPDPAAFWGVVVREMDAIEESAGDHLSYAAERIAAMLAQHGCYVAFAELPTD